MALSVVGRPVVRNDALSKATGRTLFAYDFKLPHMLHAKALPSPHAHAKIIDIDTSKAVKLKGVAVVLTGKDVPYTFGGMVKDRPFIAVDRVRFQGEPVAVVAAEDEYIAEAAIELIEVKYEELEPLLDPFESIKEGAHLLHPNLADYEHRKIFNPKANTNICNHYILRKGDVDKGFEEADHIFEDTYSTQMYQHGFIEPNVAVADMDPLSNKVTIWTNSANPYTVRKELHAALGIPFGNIRIIVPGVGGSFGGKAYCKCEPIAIAMSKAAGRPVRYALSRSEVFNMVVRGASHTKIKTGIINDGTIIARQVETVWDAGAYAECSPMISRNAGHTSAGPYKIPNIKIDGYVAYTNKNIGGAFRGYGVQELTWATECHMDDIARKLGIDPYQFRKKNLLYYGAAGSTGQVINSIGLEDCLDAARDAIENGELQKNGKDKLRGRGLACIHKASMTPSASGAIIKLNEDGTADLLLSTIEQGQGSETALAQIAAEVLGLNASDVTVRMPDTDYTPYDTTTTASRSTYSMGNAVIKAAEDIKKQLYDILAVRLNVDKSELTFEFGYFMLCENREVRYSLKDIVAEYFSPVGGTIIGHGFFKPHAVPEDPETGQTSAITPFWMYGTQAAEVEVDIKTGKVKVLNFVAAHDMGKAINPLNCKQQIEGAILQGIGGTFYEEVKLNDKGVTINANFHDYKIPTSKDVPRMEIYLIESHQPDGPFGAKGIGEPALAATAPAIRNAIFDALGIAFNELPITPERITEALKNAKLKIGKKEE